MEISVKELSEIIDYKTIIEDKDKVINILKRQLELEKKNKEYLIICENNLYKEQKLNKKLNNKIKKLEKASKS